MTILNWIKLFQNYFWCNFVVLVLTGYYYWGVSYSDELMGLFSSLDYAKPLFEQKHVAWAPASQASNRDGITCAVHQSPVLCIVLHYITLLYCVLYYATLRPQQWWKCWECRDFFINVVSGHIYGRHTTQLSLGFVSFPLASTDFSPPNWPIPCWQLLLTLAKLSTTFTMVGPQAT